MDDPTRAGIDRGPTDIVKLGVVWGLIGAIAMAMYAMIAAATYQGTGFFTPMYHIASTIIDPDTMMQSMEAAEGDNLFFFSFGPAMTGLIIHFVVGMAYGVVFAFIAHGMRLRGAVSVAGGMAYGVIAMLFSSFIGLPIAAAVFGAGDPISTMPTMVGWTTFTIEHVIYGGMLGIGHWLAHREEVEEGIAQPA